MMNSPIGLLVAEHDVISCANDGIRALQGLWNTDENAYIRQAEQLLTFFSEYADGFHHHKEEEILFKQMRNHPEFMLHDMLDELEEHHEDFRSMTSEIGQALERRDCGKAQSLLESYMDKLLDHIAVENDELFVMAESLFPEADLERMYFRCMDADAALGTEKKQVLEKVFTRS